MRSPLIATRQSAAPQPTCALQGPRVLRQLRLATGQMASGLSCKAWKRFAQLRAAESSAQQT